jgi:ABC-2 type transport system permease protein
VVPVVVGALVFDLYAPRRPITYALFVCSMLLATIVCFACRYLVNAAAYWLRDVRGPQTAWTLTSGIFGGLYFPVWFFPHAMAIALCGRSADPGATGSALHLLTPGNGGSHDAARPARRTGRLGLCFLPCAAGYRGAGSANGDPGWVI